MTVYQALSVHVTSDIMLYTFHDIAMSSHILDTSMQTVIQGLTAPV